MGSPAGPIPPFPTNDGGLGSEDQDPSTVYSPQQQLDDTLSWMSNNTDKVGSIIGDVLQKSNMYPVNFGMMFKALLWFIKEMNVLEIDAAEVWMAAEADLAAALIPHLRESGILEIGEVASMFQALFGAPEPGQVNFGSPDLRDTAEEFFNAIVAPLTLTNGNFNPTENGAGLKAQNYLLSNSMTMMLSNWLVEQIGSHTNLGLIKTMAPFLYVLEGAVNPSNVVRQAVEASYAFFLKAPLTRDLNRAYPMKELGATALAKMHLRGAIDLNTYTDRCLNLGLSTEYAQQLLLESQRELSRGDLAKLLTAGQITQDDAEKYLAQIGYDPTAIPSIIWLDTHQRYFAAQERVGTAAIAAWKKGVITQDYFESLMKQLNFTADEISVYEIEAQFEKTLQKIAGGGKSLSYGQIRELYVKNIIGVDDVMQYLENEGYSSEDVQRLVLLDFTAAEEFQLRLAELTNRMRVAAESARVSAATEATKNETALANAKTTLANELEADAKAFGDLLTAPTALQLLGLG